jgi:hypothetical protein
MNKCERCNLPVSFNRHGTIFSCVAALKRELEARDLHIKQLEERVLEVEKEIREKSWEASVR